MDDHRAFLAGLPGIDPELAAERHDDDMELYRELLVLFLEDYAGVTDRVRTALDRGQRATAVKLVHNLKGVAGNLCAQSVYGLASKLGSAVAAGDDPACRRLLAQADLVLKPLFERLAVLKAESGAD
ncbi:MAG: Hpt domain-containing protein [Spirochaetes bacterium]|nr:Hpt domain-containing protein [Spirochaetota bacterium]